MSRPPDLGPDPRPLPNGLRPTGTPSWDAEFGGLRPGELVVLVGRDLALCRDLAMIWLPGLTRGSCRAWWYRTGPTTGQQPWSPVHHYARLKAMGEHIEPACFPLGPRARRERLEDVVQRADEWATGWPHGPPVVVIVIDALVHIARNTDETRTGILRNLARRRGCPVILLDQAPRTNATGHELSAVADGATVMVHVHPGGLEVQAGPLGPSRTLAWP